MGGGGDHGSNKRYQKKVIRAVLEKTSQKARLGQTGSLLEKHKTVGEGNEVNSGCPGVRITLKELWVVGGAGYRRQKEVKDKIRQITEGT